MQTWTSEEESAFQQIMAVSDLERLPAIRLFRRCNDDLAKALKIAKECYRMSNERRAVYEKTKVARIAGLAKAREARRLNRPIEQRNMGAVGSRGTEEGN
jgi:hypothetical protein